jgi:hypothetical protein
MCTHDRPPESRTVRLARWLCPHPRVSHYVDCLGGPGYGHSECDLCGEHTAHWTMKNHPDPEERFNPRERFDHLEEH